MMTMMLSSYGDGMMVPQRRSSSIFLFASCCRCPRSGTGTGSGRRRSVTTTPTSPELVEREFAHLHLKPTPADIGHVRIRQHVNPLTISLSVPAPAPQWEDLFRDPTLPLMVDIGSGSGRFLLWLANEFPHSNNYLGLEIRQKLVKRADFWTKELALRNIYFMFANATTSFESLVATYPGPLMLVSVLCPDPYFKQRHRKRRVLQTPLVDSISNHLSPGGKVRVPEATELFKFFVPLLLVI